MCMQLRDQKNVRNLGEAPDIQMHLRSDAHLSPFFFFTFSPKGTAYSFAGCALQNSKGSVKHYEDVSSTSEKGQRTLAATLALN